MSTNSGSNTNKKRTDSLFVKMRAYVHKLLEEKPEAVERGVVALYRRQTEDEKVLGDTKHSNGRGFNITDATPGTYYAKWVLAGNKLDGVELSLARELLRKYENQLTLVALENRETRLKAQAEWEAWRARQVQLTKSPTPITLQSHRIGTTNDEYRRLQEGDAGSFRETRPSLSRARSHN